MACNSVFGLGLGVVVRFPLKSAGFDFPQILAVFGRHIGRLLHLFPTFASPRPYDLKS